MTAEPREIAKTERLTIRELTFDDLDGLAAILCDPVTMSFYPRPFTREDVRGWIERNMKSYEARGFGLWALELIETGEFVGECGITLPEVEGERHPELGWHVNRRLWRRGYASEAGATARDLGFERFGLDHLISLVLPENVPSGGVAKKLGMRIERQVDYKGLLHNLWMIEAPNARG